MFHFFLVDYNDKGYMYQVGISSEVPINDIKKHFKQYSKDVLYAGTRLEVKPKYLKTKQNTPVGEIFYTKFMFDKCMKVPKDHWSSKLRRDLLARQDGEVFFIEEQDA